MDSFKIYDVTDWTRNNYNILPNILRSKGNQTMKFGQIIEYNTINIFLEKPSANHGGEDPFIKKSKLTYVVQQIDRQLG